MSTFQIVPFLPEHYLVLAAVAFPWLRSPHRVASTMAEDGPAWSAVRDGHALACAGVIVPWPGFGSAWALVDPVAQKEPLALHYAVRRGLDTIIREHHLRRVEASVQCDVERNVRWAMALGFRIESKMPRWGPGGETFYRMVRWS